MFDAPYAIHWPVTEYKIHQKVDFTVQEGEVGHSLRYLSLSKAQFTMGY